LNSLTRRNYDSTIMEVNREIAEIEDREVNANEVREMLKMTLEQ